MRRSAPNSERSDTLETREKLLTSAFRIFARVGFHGAGIRAISADAGVNVALVGYHFGSKEGMYLEVVARLCAVVDERLRDASETARRALNDVSGADAVEQACRLLDPFMDMVMDASTSDLARVMMHEQLNPGPGFQTFHELLTVPFVELLGGLIAKARGTALSEDERMSALSIMGMLLIFKSAQASSELLFATDQWGPRQRVMLRNTLARAIAAAT